MNGDVKERIVNKRAIGNNESFENLVRTAGNRRSFMQGGLSLLAMGFIGGGGNTRASSVSGELVGFRPLPRNGATGKWLGVSPDYEVDVIIPWGEPIVPGGPAFSWPTNADDQARQVGSGHDGMWLFPGADENRGVLCLNHEYASNRQILGKQLPETQDDVRTVQHAHGVSVLAVERIDGQWSIVDSEVARRIHVNTPIDFGGPAAVSPLLIGGENDTPRGTLNNCGCGHTPWGTYLTCEENFNFYFAASDSNFELTPEQERYGFLSSGGGWNWHLFDDRFDLSKNASAAEQNRFGWVVEIDPVDATKPPVKRTALGRFKHESCEVVVGKDNRVVAYMGDDERFNYIYKFVGNEDFREILKRGESPLDLGKLFVAKFLDDRTGEWLELSESNPILKEKVGTIDRILVYARLSADIVGATPMDRPEWISLAPGGLAYCSLTNNSNRKEPDAANPMAPNDHGHIIRWQDSDHHIGTTFEWEIFKIARTTHNTEESFGSPDSIWIDPDGRLFIATDGSQADGLNNQLLVANTQTGEIKRLFSGVPGCEVTGITPNSGRTELFVNVQHPGNADIRVSDFPRLDANPLVPRDATVRIRRKNGGVVGS